MKRINLFSPMFRRFLLGAMMLLLIGGFLSASFAKGKSADGGATVYLPFIVRGQPREPVLLGITPRTYWPSDGSLVPGALAQEFAPIDSWSGKHLSLASVYHSFDQSDTVTYMLSEIWDGGYTPFVNIGSDHSIQSIASGGIDDQIHAWARSFAAFADGGQRMAYLLPLQEMNGDWAPYGSSDPTYFKSAFQRIRNIFAAEGVPEGTAQWVFAPNGLSSTGWPDFEAYYPGDSIVDGVAFSSFNYGYHPANPYPRWENPDQIYTPYIDRMRTMAPGKPIFIAQLGTTAYGPDGYDESLKNQWLIDAYTLFAQSEGVKGILYYNDHNVFDWSFYRPANNAIFPGYITGVSRSVYKYVSPADLRDSLVP